ncbi:putative bifunctional diguanylate cyclase/phosphodiesterase [Hydrogenimonas thermophila]|uniref:Diguanylate cyclase (GGDEF) domain-containing protein n=1 Tax=Hydrogenimonas thermophila TaxID=223786 RepID=A0A1I5RFJ0_9BACT|nr:EAL domain-containing protein [Hydrogenimonas thermophila]SFP57324.1 diguanylate cyclase (GGDEF) domain-containing protein [Hydrogenimonas thermophila]
MNINLAPKSLKSLLQLVAYIWIFLFMIWSFFNTYGTYDLLKKVEEKSIINIVKNSLEEISIAIELGMEEEAKDRVNEIIQSLPNIKHIVFKSNNKSYEFGKIDPSMAYKELNFDIKYQNKKVGALKAYIVFSNAKVLFQRYVWSIVIFFSIFGLLTFILVYYINSSLKRLYELSTYLENLSLKAPKPVPIKGKYKEVKTIIEAINALIKRISEHMKALTIASSKLKENQFYLLEAQKIGHIGSWVYIPDKDYFKASSELYRILGRNFKEKMEWKDFVGYIEEKSEQFLHMIDESIKNCTKFEMIISFKNELGKKVILKTVVNAKKYGSSEVKLIGVSLDITDMEKAKEEISYLAMHDTLTGLVNRAMLKEHLQLLINEAKRKKESELAILFIDLDHFKLINDSLGHEVGDALLVELAERINNNIRSEDIAARIGGDEFVVVMFDIQSKEDVMLVANKLHNLISKPFYPLGYEVMITSSIGISFYPEHGKSVDELLRFSDMAMYQAKEKGRNGIIIFDNSFAKNIDDQQMLEQDLRYALKNDPQQIVLYFQPKVDPTNDKIIGAEALVRWHHPKKGVLSPAHFIELAESTGLILPLGEIVLRKSMEQVKRWEGTVFENLILAVNLSGRQFQDKNLEPLLRSLVDEYKIDPGKIELEITELTSMTMVHHTINVLHRIRSIGYKIAIDDFGTGYSSLAYLRDFPISTIKIDRSFIMNIEEEQKSITIVKLIIGMSRTLEFTVVAEGVETIRQKELLKSYGVDLIQGYFYNKPLPLKEFEEYVLKTN